MTQFLGFLGFVILVSAIVKQKTDVTGTSAFIYGHNLGYLAVILLAIYLLYRALKK